MTKKEMFTNAISIIEFAKNEYSREDAAKIDEVIEGLNHEIELLERKSATPKKPTATQVENESFKSTLVEFFSNTNEKKSIKEIQSEVPEVAQLSNQRITHLLTDLVKNGTLTKTYEKKVPYYSIA